MLSVLYLNLALFCLAALPLSKGSVINSLPPLGLQPRSDGSQSIAALRRHRKVGHEELVECHATFSPRGIAVVVKGPPWLPMEKFHLRSSLGPEDFEWLRSAGINVIRLGAMWPGLMPHPPFPNGTYRINESYLDGLKRVVAQAAAAGIYTLLEFHQDTLSEQFCGEGIPLWVAAELQEGFRKDFPEEVVELVHAALAHVPGLESILDSEVRAEVSSHLEEASFPAPLFHPFPPESKVPPYGAISLDTCNSVDTGYMMWTDFQLSFEAGHAYKTLLDVQSKQFQHFLEYWRALTAAFKGNPHVLGFDLFNEPWPGSFYTEPWMMLPHNFAPRLERFSKRVTELIHSVDSTRLVVFSQPQIEEATSVAEMLNWPKKHLCPRLTTMFGGALRKLEKACDIIWDLRVWMPADGFIHTAIQHVPLDNRSIFGFHYYRPPQGNPDFYAQQRLGDVKRLHTAGLLTETCCMDWPWPGLIQDTYWFEQSGAGWIVWAYKPQASGWPTAYWGSWRTGNGPDMFSRSTGEPIMQNWRTIAHPSAQFVSGEVLLNAFESWHGRFNLTFRPEQSSQEWDAIVLWPGGWWAEEGKDEPIITVAPAGAADVFEVEWFPTEDPPRTKAPKLRAYGVRVLQQVSTISIVMDFEDFQYTEEHMIWPAQFGHSHWWRGLAWPMSCAGVLLATMLVVCICFQALRSCCRLCRRWASGCNPFAAVQPSQDHTYHKDASLGATLSRLLHLPCVRRPALARPLLSTTAQLSPDEMADCHYKVLSP